MRSFIDVHHKQLFFFSFLEAQLNRERVIQTVDSVVQGGEGRNLALGLHQLPVRPVTQNGKHITAAVATGTSLANSSGKIFAAAEPVMLNMDKEGDKKFTVAVAWSLHTCGYSPL